jgi:hypothetical protein
MSTIYLIISLLIFTSFSYSQSGCTDSNATNYDSKAIVNDGSCQYLLKIQDFTFKYNLPGKISESSGLIFTEGFLWTHNDSGNSNSFYKLNPLDGSLVQEISVSNAPNNDWEDITYDEQFIYLGDFGNNDGNRKDLKVLKISKDSILNKSASFITVNAEKIEFSYADQVNFVANNKHNFDCESVISKGDSLYLFTKNRGDFKSKLYALPKIPGVYSISPIDTLNSECLITGADYNKTTNEVVLIGYSSSKDKSYIFYLNDYPNSSYFKGNKRKLQINQQYVGLQTEGICYISNDSIAFSCEFSAIQASVFSFEKSNTHFLSLNNIQENVIQIYPNPVTEILKIVANQKIKEIQISNTQGVIIYINRPNQSEFGLNINSINKISKGVYNVQIKFEQQIVYKKLIID